MLVRKESKTNLSSFMYRTIFPGLSFIFTRSKKGRDEDGDAGRGKGKCERQSEAPAFAHTSCSVAVPSPPPLTCLTPVPSSRFRLGLLCSKSSWYPQAGVTACLLTMVLWFEMTLTVSPFHPSCFLKGRKRLYRLPQGSLAENTSTLYPGGAWQRSGMGWACSKWLVVRSEHLQLLCSVVSTHEWIRQSQPPPAPKVCVVIACILRKRIHKEVKTCVAQVAELGFEPSCLAGALKLYAP